MPLIYVVNTGETVETDLVTSILVALQRYRVPIETICGGRAKCGRCVIRILKGGGYLTGKKTAEIIRLQAIKAGEDFRLACQTHTRGDIEIEIVNLKK